MTTNAPEVFSALDTKICELGFGRASPAIKTGRDAPALQKGLDILELLAEVAVPLTLSDMALRLRRSVGEIFRMVQILERRDYILALGSGVAYTLAPKAFNLALCKPATSLLIADAIHFMNGFTERTNWGCHLSFQADMFNIVAVRSESAVFGFNASLRAKSPMVNSVAGTVLHAFMEDMAKSEFDKRLQQTLHASEWDRFDAGSRLAASLGYAQAPNPGLSAVTDLSFPVFRASIAVAALTGHHAGGSIYPPLSTFKCELAEIAQRLSF